MLYKFDRGLPISFDSGLDTVQFDKLLNIKYIIQSHELIMALNAHDPNEILILLYRNLKTRVGIKTSVVHMINIVYYENCTV